MDIIVFTKIYQMIKFKVFEKNTAMRNIKPLLSGTADMTSLQIVLLYATMAITYV